MNPAIRRNRRKLRYEVLEDRRLLAGDIWANHKISFSFVPDGTALDGGHTSHLIEHLDSLHARDDWQREIARALQTWASVAQLDFYEVTDDGSPLGSLGSPQNDSRFGDIRIGGREMDALGYSFGPNRSTIGGDIRLSTSYTYGLGESIDLYTLALHETGHALGLSHSDAVDAVMSGTNLFGVHDELSDNDIEQIQALYGARRDDAFDQARDNGSLATATAWTIEGEHDQLTADLTRVDDADYYQLQLPAMDAAPWLVEVAAHQSLAQPRLQVFVDSQLISESAETSFQLPLLTSGQTVHVAVFAGADDAFGTGAYELRIRTVEGVVEESVFNQAEQPTSGSDVDASDDLASEPAGQEVIDNSSETTMAPTSDEPAAPNGGVGTTEATVQDFASVTDGLSLDVPADQVGAALESTDESPIVEAVDVAPEDASDDWSFDENDTVFVVGEPTVLSQHQLAADVEFLDAEGGQLDSPLTAPANSDADGSTTSAQIAPLMVVIRSRRLSALQMVESNNTQAIVRPATVKIDLPAQVNRLAESTPASGRLSRWQHLLLRSQAESIPEITDH